MTLKVLSARCSECLFGPNKIVSDARKAQLLRQCARNDGHFTCHKATLANDDAVCRGFYDTRSTNLIRIMGRLGGLRFVTESELGTETTR